MLPTRLNSLKLMVRTRLVPSASGLPGHSAATAGTLAPVNIRTQRGTLSLRTMLRSCSRSRNSWPIYCPDESVRSLDHFQQQLLRLIAAPQGQTMSGNIQFELTKASFLKENGFFSGQNGGRRGTSRLPV